MPPSPCKSVGSPRRPRWASTCGCQVLHKALLSTCLLPHVLEKLVKYRMMQHWAVLKYHSQDQGFTCIQRTLHKKAPETAQAVLCNLKIHAPEQRQAAMSILRSSLPNMNGMRLYKRA